MLLGVTWKEEMVVKIVSPLRNSIICGTSLKSIFGNDSEMLTESTFYLVAIVITKQCFPIIARGNKSQTSRFHILLCICKKSGLFLLGVICEVINICYSDSSSMCFWCYCCFMGSGRIWEGKPCYQGEIWGEASLVLSRKISNVILMPWFAYLWHIMYHDTSWNQVMEDLLLNGKINELANAFEKLRYAPWTLSHRPVPPLKS